MYEDDITFSTGATIWLVLGIIGNIFFSTILIGIAGFWAIFSLIGVGLDFWLLVGKKRLAFYLNVVLVVLICFFNLVVFQDVCSAFFGLFNPVITYALISKQWPYMS